MDVSSVGSTIASAGTGQGAPSFVGATSPASGSSLPVNASAPSAAGTTQVPSSAQLAQAVKQVNDAFSQRNLNVYASIGKDPATGIEVVKFVDQDTNEAISQFPSKAVLAIAQSLQDSPNSGGKLLNANA
jgi:uncharacterized FlaG/YvyC family protein